MSTIKSIDIVRRQQFEAIEQEHRIDYGLEEAQREASENSNRYDYNEVASVFSEKLIAKLGSSNL